MRKFLTYRCPSLITTWKSQESLTKCLIQRFSSSNGDSFFSTPSFSVYTLARTLVVDTSPPFFRLNTLVYLLQPDVTSELLPESSRLSVKASTVRELSTGFKPTLPIRKYRNQWTIIYDLVLPREIDSVKCLPTVDSREHLRSFYSESKNFPLEV